MDVFIDGCKVFECHNPANMEKKINEFLQKNEGKIRIISRKVVFQSVNRIAIMVCYQNVKSEVSERVMVLSHDNIDEVTNKEINSVISQQKLKVVDILLDCHQPGSSHLIIDVAMIFCLK